MVNCKWLIVNCYLPLIINHYFTVAGQCWTSSLFELVTSLPPQSKQGLQRAPRIWAGGAPESMLFNY